ncbi:hypothetical protein Golax_003420 [Gossypium laxum]|uniref:Uncharacterized protein n=1 Tax=Gossypium laxum TaxID=34288 RepID=A0A7J9AH19_9ROSI|nr:hypothetical protein [Gossypium laxum]
MEGSMDDSEHSTHRIQWSFVGSLNWHMESHQLFLADVSEPIWGKRKVPDDISELTENISNLEIRLRVKDEEFR